MQIKSYKAGEIHVTKHAVEWDDIEQSVMRRLAEVPTGATAYLNGEYTLTAPEGTPLDAFMKQTRRFLVLWNKRLARVLGAGVRKKMIKQAEFPFRQILFTGVLILRGELVDPNGWPDNR
jgi:hypothetical protein